MWQMPHIILLALASLQERYLRGWSGDRPPGRPSQEYWRSGWTSPLKISRKQNMEGSAEQKKGGDNQESITKKGT